MAKVHIHSEQFDDALHAWCGRDGVVVMEEEFEATAPVLRCALCDRDWFPNGQPDWHLKQAQSNHQAQATVH